MLRLIIPYNKKAMSALLTQTLEEEVQVLLVAQDTALSHQLREKIKASQPQLQVRLKSWRQILASEKDLTAEGWYRLVFLFEEPQLQAFSQNEMKDFFNDLPKNLLEKTKVIFPLTSQVKRGNHQSEQVDLEAWFEQNTQELALFKIINQQLTADQLIFYQNLMKIDSYPLKYFLEKVEAGYLVDLKADLDLLSQDLLISKLTSLSLRPQPAPVLIKGSTVASSELLTSTQEILNQYGQPIKLKSHSFSLSPTEILAEISTNVEEKTLSADQKKLAKWIAKQLVGSADKQTEKKPSESQLESQSSGSEIQPPQKEGLIKKWNQLKESFVEKNRQVIKNDKSDLNDKKTDEPVKKDPELETSSLFSELREKQNSSHLEKLSKETKRGLKKIKHHRFLFWFGGLITLISISSLAVAVFYFINFRRIKATLLRGFINQSFNQITTAEEVKQLNKLLDLTRDKTGPVGDLLSSSLLPRSGQILDLTAALVDFKEAKFKLAQTTTQLYQQIMIEDSSESNVSFPELIAQLKTENNQAHRASAFLISELKNLELNSFSTQQAAMINEYQESLADQEKALTQLRQLSPVLPGLLGSEQPRVYAVVLQNEQELRPTGGFIEAVALLTFVDGQLTKLQVEDVYQLDQQLKGVMQPPADLVRFLGEERWYLRDANWQPDFAETSQRIAWFIDQSLGVEVDGVVALNLEVLEQLLVAVGPVNLPSYNEVITAKNIDERMEYHSEVQLDNSQLENYPQLILREILTTFQELESSKIQALLAQTREMFEAKELIAAVLNPEEEGIFASLGWGGRMLQPVCPTIFGDVPCITDNLAQVEANVGINKANYYLDRQIDHTIQLRADQINHRRLITYKNQAPSNTWPKGPYQAYTRFYLPSEAQLEEVKINQQTVNPSELTTATLNDQLIVGVYTKTPVGDKTELEISYSLPYSQPTPFTYVFFDRKQAGARESSPRVFLNHSPDLEPSLIAPQAEVQGEVIVFNPSKSTGHTFVGATFE